MRLFSVLVTGANSVIGLKLVSYFLHLGKEELSGHIFAIYGKEDSIEELYELQKYAPDSVTVYILKFDILDRNDLTKLRQFVEDTVGEKGLTLLINNGGRAKKSHLEPVITAESMKTDFKVNTVGPMLVALEFLPLLKKSASLQPGSGKSFSKAGILNITSVSGSITKTQKSIVGDLSLASYKISKAALHMAMRMMAAKVNSDDVLVLNMCPGWVQPDSELGAQGGEVAPEVCSGISVMMDTMEKLNENHHGSFINRFGNSIPW